MIYLMVFTSQFSSRYSFHCFPQGIHFTIFHKVFILEFSSRYSFHSFPPGIHFIVFLHVIFPSFSCLMRWEWSNFYQVLMN